MSVCEDHVVHDILKQTEVTTHARGRDLDAMADLKLDNEFGSELAGAGSRPAFAHLVRFRPKDVRQKEFPTTLHLT